MNQLIAVLVIVVLQIVLIVGVDLIAARIVKRDLALPLQLVLCVALPALTLWKIGPTEAYYIGSLQVVLTVYVAWSWGRSNEVDSPLQFAAYGAVTALLLGGLGVMVSLNVWRFTLADELRAAPERVAESLRTAPAAAPRLAEDLQLKKPYLLVDCGPHVPCTTANSTLLSLPAWCRTSGNQKPATVVARVFLEGTQDFKAIAFEWPSLRPVGAWRVSSAEESQFFDSLTFATTPTAPVPSAN
jgi:hypothetical protein